MNNITGTQAVWSKDRVQQKKTEFKAKYYVYLSSEKVMSAYISYIAIERPRKGRKCHDTWALFKSVLISLLDSIKYRYKSVSLSCGVFPGYAPDSTRI